MASRACCSRGRNTLLGLLENDIGLLQREVTSSGVRPARCAYQYTARCTLHTSVAQDWTHSLAWSNHIHNRYHQHFLPANVRVGGPQSWASVAAKQDDAKADPRKVTEPSDGQILSELLVHIWPPDNFEFRGRVVGALALLAGSKLLNIQVRIVQLVPLGMSARTVA